MPRLSLVDEIAGSPGKSRNYPRKFQRSSTGFQNGGVDIQVHYILIIKKYG